MAAVRNMNDCSGTKLGGDSRHASLYRSHVDNDLIGIKAAIRSLGAEQVYGVTKFEIFDGAGPDFRQLCVYEQNVGI